MFREDLKARLTSALATNWPSLRTRVTICSGGFSPTGAGGEIDFARLINTNHDALIYTSGSKYYSNMSSGLDDAANLEAWINLGKGLVTTTFLPSNQSTSDGTPIPQAYRDAALESTLSNVSEGYTRNSFHNTLVPQQDIIMRNVYSIKSPSNQWTTYGSLS